jgi:DMSO/TMAO reductase YedYZ heme-binding membrane subunit
MLIVKKINAYLGLILAIIAITISPILKVPIKGNWNLYQTDSRLFFISFAIIGLTAICLFLKQLRTFRFFAIVCFIWSLLMAVAVYFKSNNYFGSKFFDKVLAKTIHYQWGWIVLLVAVLLLITSVKREQLTVNS